MDVTNHEVFQTIWYFKSLDLSKKVQLKFGGQKFIYNVHWFWNQINRPLETIKRPHDSRELNACCGLIHDRILDWFFLQKEQLKATVYWDILELNVNSKTDYVESELGLFFISNTILYYILVEESLYSIFAKA